MSKLSYISNCVDSFDEDGECVIPQLPFNNTSDFAVCLAEAEQITNEAWAAVAPVDFDYIEINLTHFYKSDELYLAYDEHDDIHYFFA